VLAMRRLVIALRHRLAGEAVPAGLLRQTWLEPELTPLIEDWGEAVDVLARLEKALAEEYPFTSGLTVLFLNQGPGAVESSLNGGMLALAVRRSADPVVRRLLQGLIDLRNLLAIMRHWRWQLRLAPALLAGGSIPPGPLLRTWAGGDRATFGRLARGLAGQVLPDMEPRLAEDLLLAGLGKELRRAGRDPLGTGVVLDYLWRCEMMAREALLRSGDPFAEGLQP